MAKKHKYLLNNEIQKFRHFDGPKNKPNSNPIKPKTNPIKANSKMNAFEPIRSHTMILLILLANFITLKGCLPNLPEYLILLALTHKD
jgi:hypothetical protein